MNNVKNEKSLLKKLIIGIIAGLAVLAVGLIVYFAVAKPAEETSSRPEKMYEGEGFVDSSSVLLMFEEHERGDIESITVQNPRGKYTLAAHTEKDFSRFVLADRSIVYMKTADLAAIISDKSHNLPRESGATAYYVSGDVSRETLSSVYGIDPDGGETISVTLDGAEYVFVLGSRRNIDSGYNYYVMPRTDDGKYYVYSVIAITSTTKFALEGYEDTVLDEYSVSGVVAASTVVATAPLSKKNYRVSENATYEELTKYGLDDGSSPIRVSVKLIDGGEYSFTIGDKIPSGGGYYAIADGRRGDDGGYIVYILTSSTAGTFTAGSESLLDTLAAPYLGSDAGNISDFQLYRTEVGGDRRSLLVRVGLAGEGISTAESSTYTLVYPAAYTLDETAFYDKVVGSVTIISGDEVMSFGERIHMEEIYSKYGLDLDRDRLDAETDKNHAKLTFSFESSPEEYYTVYFSEKMTSDKGEEFYYVYSTYYESIIKLPAEGYEFIEWGLAKFTRGSLYFNYINCTDYFELISKKTSVRYTMSGNEKSLSAVVTEAGENGAPLTRMDSDGNVVDGIFKLQYRIKTVGTYTSTEYYGDFENFRSLFYVLITRTLSLEESPAGKVIASEPSYKINVADSPCDQPMSYTRYDSAGNKVYYTDESGNRRLAQVRYAGGNIVCSDIVVTSSDGTVLNYDTAYYDEEEGRFFLKVVSTNDGNLKPANYKYDEENNLVVSRYLPQTTTGKYTQTVYEHNIYDIYNVYTDASGKEVRQINQTYKYDFPTVTKNEYRIEADGTRTLLSSTTETAQEGTLIRSQMIEKLFSDSDKLLSGVEINREDMN